MREQFDMLRRGLHIAVATPGRLKDLLGKRKMNLDVCLYLCLDEADRMVDSTGFEEEVREVRPHRRALAVRAWPCFCKGNSTMYCPRRGWGGAGCGWSGVWLMLMLMLLRRADHELLQGATADAHVFGNDASEDPRLRRERARRPGDRQRRPRWCSESGRHPGGRAAGFICIEHLLWRTNCANVGGET